MHSTNKRPSHIERCGGMPGMWWAWPLRRLQRLPLVLAPDLHPTLLLVREQRGRPKQRRRVRHPRKGEMVPARFIRDVHAHGGAGANAGP
jgi:hypothetical protein